MPEKEKKNTNTLKIKKPPTRISRRQFAIGSIAVLGSSPLVLSDSETPKPPFKLDIKETVKSLMEDRHILQDDLVKEIQYAEKTGEKLYQKDCDRFLAKLKLSTVYYYAEYSPVEGGFEIHNTYSHRFTLEGTM